VEPWIRNAARSELGFDDTEKVIGIVGALSPVKDHGTFLEAAALLSIRLPSARFLCVGGEEPGMEHYALAIRHRASELGLKGIVQWLGDRSDVPRLIATLDLLTSSSKTEGSSNVIAEGMACGVPCVVTNVGDSADIVGDTGIVVRPEQPKALADAWVRTLALSAEDRRSIGARARRRVEKCFSADRMVDKTLRVLQQVVSE
jgi:glycosyltransferase involved in cell wall biosynthesis